MKAYAPMRVDRDGEKMVPLLAFLRRPDGEVRSVCLGCSEVLAEQGMIEIVEERPMRVVNADPNAFSSIIYEIVRPFTLAECRAAIIARHVGPLQWGE